MKMFEPLSRNSAGFVKCPEGFRCYKDEFSGVKNTDSKWLTLLT